MFVVCCLIMWIRNSSNLPPLPVGGLAQCWASWEKSTILPQFFSELNKVSRVYLVSYILLFYSILSCLFMRHHLLLSSTSHLWGFAGCYLQFICHPDISLVFLNKLSTLYWIFMYYQLDALYIFDCLYMCGLVAPNLWCCIILLTAWLCIFCLNVTFAYTITCLHAFPWYVCFIPTGNALCPLPTLSIWIHCHLFNI